MPQCAAPAAAIIASERLAALESIRAYVSERLLPAMNVASPFELRPAAAGSKSLVYFLEMAGRPALVLRAETNTRLLRKRARNHDFLSRRGFACPRNQFADFRRTTLARFGYCFLVERRVPGHAIEECDSPTAPAAVGRLFARLHQFTGFSSGPCTTWWRRPAAVSRSLKARAARWLEMHRQFELPGHREIAKWLAALPPAAWRQRPRLCHQDVSANNVLIVGEEIGLVDLGELGYGSAAFELARLKVKLFPSNEAAWRCCREAYLVGADDSLREEIERTALAGLALAYLRSAVHGPTDAARRQPLEELLRIVS